MKAPERIYVEVCEDGIFAFPEPPFAESVEYVRANVVRQPASEELEEEIKRYGKEEMPVVLESDLNDIARHFYELGRNAKEEEK